MVSLWLALALWGLLPGYLLVRALGLGWSHVETLCAAPGLSLGAVSAAAYLSELAQARVSPLGVLPALVVIIALVHGLRSRFGPARAKIAPTRDPAWVPWLVLAAPVAVFVMLGPMRTVPVLPPTLHDGLDHARYFRAILDHQSLDRFVLALPPFYVDGTPLFYPWGFHAWLALVGGTTSVAPMQAFSGGLLFVSCAIPLSVYAFTSRFLDRGFPSVASAWLMLFVWELPFEIWRWGGYALLAGAVALLPLARVSLSALSRPAPFFATALVAVGVLLIHPSQAMGALLIAAAVALCLAATRALPRRTALLWIGAVILVALGLSLGPRLWQPLREFAERAHRQGDLVMNQPVWDWPLGVYGRPIRPNDGRLWVFALAAFGGLVSLRKPEGRVFLVLHVLGSLMILLAHKQTWLTMLFYHEPERIWYLQFACLPALAALGLDTVVGVVCRAKYALARRGVVWPALAAFGFAVLGVPFYPRATGWLHHYARARLSFTDHRVLRDFDWVSHNVPAGETIFNAPADYGLGMPFTGRRFLFWPGGFTVAGEIDWRLVLRAFNRPEQNFPIGLGFLQNVGIHYVFAARYADDRAPLYRESLDENPALARVYRSETASVYRIRRFWVHYFGIERSREMELDGFYPLEEKKNPDWRDVTTEYRWTNGLGRVTVRRPENPGDACRFVVSGPGIAPYRVFLNGTELGRTRFGFVMPSELLRDTTLVFEIRSADRVQVTALSFYCALE
jgi:Family of unknown function (DUF6541)